MTSDVPLKASDLLKILEEEATGSSNTRRRRDAYRTKHPEAGRHRLEAGMTNYAIIIEHAEDGGYGVWCPDLPGVVALADSEAGVIAEMTEAIEFHIEGMRQDGQPIPHPATVAATVISTDAA
jgi:predicted RNase H-like HicB family nuclease